MKLDTSVWHILRQKDVDTIWTVSSFESVREAALLMCRNKIGALLVTDASSILGILTEKECVRRVLTRRGEIDVLKVKDVMEKKIVCVTPHTTTEQCFAIMTEYRARYLIVIDQGQLVGLISIGDVVKAMIADNQFAIEQLEQYISGSQTVYAPRWESWRPGLVQRIDPRHEAYTDLP